MIFVDIALTIIDPLQLVISLPIDHINKSIEKSRKYQTTETNLIKKNPKLKNLNKNKSEANW
jgi:hypothetical protein